MTFVLAAFVGMDPIGLCHQDAIAQVAFEQHHSAPPSPVSELPADWIDALNHDDYHRREATRMKILAAGRQTFLAHDRPSNDRFDNLIAELRGELHAGSVDSTIETRWQCGSLIQQLEDEFFASQVRRLRGFHIDATELRFPLWSPFQRLMGDGYHARCFFAGLLDTHRRQLQRPDRLAPFQVAENDDRLWSVLFLVDAADALRDRDQRSDSDSINVPAFVLGNQPHSRLLPGSLASQLTVCLTNPSLGPQSLQPTRSTHPTDLEMATDREIGPMNSRDAANLITIARRWRDLRGDHFSDSQAFVISLRIDPPGEARRLARSTLVHKSICPKTTAMALILSMQAAVRLNPGDVNEQDRIQAEVPAWLHYRTDHRVVATSTQQSASELIQIETRVSDVLLAMNARSLGRDPRTIGFKYLTADPMWVYDIDSLGFATDAQRSAAWKSLGLIVGGEALSEPIASNDAIRH